MRKFWSSLFLNKIIYKAAAAIVAVLLLGYSLAYLYYIGMILIALFIFALLADLLYLYVKIDIQGKRLHTAKLSLGTSNTIGLKFEINTNREFRFRLIDELPAQLQIRDFNINGTIQNDLTLEYTITPNTRGIYSFGKTHMFIRSKWGWFERRYSFDNEEDVLVYPNTLQLKKYALKTRGTSANQLGLKKVRKVGLSFEFDQISNYVEGDDVRHINWKASGRHQSLMINRYQEEKAQNVYVVLDKGRQMQSPFDGLRLVDYAVNSSVVMSHVALNKGDRIGLISFSGSIESAIKADNKSGMKMRLLEALYRLNPDHFEPDFEELYFQIKRMAPTRSLVMLYTNFESEHSLRRALPWLKMIQKNHLLVVIQFENTELNKFALEKAENFIDVLEKSIAGKLYLEKKYLNNILKKAGILSLLTTPKDLTIDALNKYTELKARGAI